MIRPDRRVGKPGRAILRRHLSNRPAAVYPVSMDTVPVIVLKPREEDRLLAGHPWVYDNEIASAEGLEGASPGAEVRIRASRGRILGRGLWSPSSKIRVRRYSFRDEAFDEALVLRRVTGAIDLRRRFFDPAADSFRAVFAEADGLPGLIVDRYVGEGDAGVRGSWLVVQFLCAGADARRDTILGVLSRVLAPDGIMERSDSPVRRLEGLEQRAGVVAGSVPGRVVIVENGLRFGADLAAGQKTGWFMDQRANRAAVAGFARGRKVLDAFCNAGGFALAAAAAGAASVLGVDSSPEAVAAVRDNAALNGLADVEALEANAFDFLREAGAHDARYGLVVLDPPAFAKNRASLDGAIRGYKEINLRGMRLLDDGGVLATFSCSFWLPRERFIDVLEDAAADAGVRLRYLSELGQAPDHPVVSGYRESRYLKGFILEVERR